MSVLFMWLTCLSSTTIYQRAYPPPQKKNMALVALWSTMASDVQVDIWVLDSI